MTTGELIEAGVAEWMVQSMDRLARGHVTDLNSYLVSISTERVLEDTRANCRCHFIGRDGNGRPRVQALAIALAEFAVDYCIPRSRIEEALRHFELTRSTNLMVRLSDEARQLFTALDKSGEGGEMLLFLLLEHLLGIPQILCKMSLKTNSQMHVHGADGVHATAIPGGGLALYWCESKLYQSVDAGIDACFRSIAPFLLDEGGGDSSRDILLIRDNLDTGDPELDEHLVQYFVADTLEATKVEVRGASLVGFDLDEYPIPFEDDGVSITNQVETLVEDWFNRIGRNVTNLDLESFVLEVFCIPFPAVAEFRQALRQALGIE